MAMTAGVDSKRSQEQPGKRRHGSLWLPRLREGRGCDLGYAPAPAPGAGGSDNDSRDASGREAFVLVLTWLKMDFLATSRL
jgi:hypothetical protein